MSHDGSTSDSGFGFDDPRRERRLRARLVNFAARGGPAGVDLRDRPKAALPEAVEKAGIEFAHGHPQATGGSLPTADFERLLKGLGFL